MKITAKLSVGLASLRGLVKNRRQSSKFKRELAAIAKDLGDDVVKRFERFSRGQGDWPAIKPETARRKGNRRILFHTGDLLAGVKQGLWQKVTVSGSRVTLTVQLRARRRHKPSGLPMQKMIEIHQTPLGHVPQRKILVRPSPAARERARRRLVKAAR